MNPQKTHEDETASTVLLTFTAHAAKIFLDEIADIYAKRCAQLSPGQEIPAPPKVTVVLDASIAMYAFRRLQNLAERADEQRSK